MNQYFRTFNCIFSPNLIMIWILLIPSSFLFKIFSPSILSYQTIQFQGMNYESWSFISFQSSIVEGTEDFFELRKKFSHLETKSWRNSFLLLFYFRRNDFSLKSQFFPLKNSWVINFNSNSPYFYNFQNSQTRWVPLFSIHFFKSLFSQILEQR